MALKTFVLINTVTNLSDARYCAGMHVNIIGFNVEEGNDKYISPDTFRELSEWLSGVEYVIEFEDSSVDTILHVSSHYNYSYIRVNDAAIAAQLIAHDKAVILALDLSVANDLQLPKASYVVVFAGDNLNSSDMEILQSLSNQHNILLGTGVTAANVNDLISTTDIKGIALTGGDEIKPGFKDYDELADILEALEIDE